MSHKILVFIPMYNCAQQVARVLGKFDSRVANVVDAVLVVDNGSTDGGLPIAQTALETVSKEGIRAELIQNDENVSLGGSHKVGFNYMQKHGFDYMIVLHGDDQGSILDIVPHLESKAYEGVDAFLGARFMSGSSLQGYSALRIFLNRCCNLVCSIVGLRRIYDIGSGLNMYSREFLSSKFYMSFPNNMNFNVYLLFYKVYSASRFKYFPITWREDDQVSNANLVKQGIEILKILFLFRFFPKRLYGDVDNAVSKMAYTSTSLYRSSDD